MTQEEIYDKAIQQGWTVDQIIIFAKEALEGWVWISKTGEEYEIVGDWHKPVTIPPEVIASLGGK